MGFKSVMKKVGKVAKVVAPFALDFVPGGQLAHLAMAAGLGAATTKGGVKSRLLGAGVGAGSEYAGHLMKGGGFNPVAKGKDITRAPMFGIGTSTSPQPGKPGQASSVLGRVFGAGSQPVNPDGSLAPAIPEGIGHKLLSDPKTYLAALAAFQQPQGDSRRAFKNGEFEGLKTGFEDYYGGIKNRMANPDYYYNTAARQNPAPVNVNGMQIAGGLHTTPEEEQLRREQESRNMGRG